MRNEKILAKDVNLDFENLVLPELSQSEKNVFELYVEINRHFQEINNLYRIFQFNLNSLLDTYVLNTNDIFELKCKENQTEEDYIMINAFTINFVSSGKILTDSMETLSTEINKNVLRTEFDFKKNCISCHYDKNFSYRLLYHLRNFSQHGHLPVNITYDKKLNFDLDHILETPHFSHNSLHKAQMENFRKEIYEKFEDYPYITYTKSIAEYNLTILEIYVDFILYFEEPLRGLVNKVEEILKCKPEIIHSNPDSFNGFVFYDCIDGNLHCIDTNEKPLEFFNNTKKDFLETLAMEQENFKIFDGCFKFDN